MRTTLTALTGTALLATGSALAAPLPLTPTQSGPVPAYDNRLPDNTTVIEAACGYFSGAACSTGTSVSQLQGTAESIGLSSGGVIEAVGTTQLNPYGANDVAFAFIFAGAQSPQITGATFSSLTGYSTSVEACGPIFGSAVEGCANGAPGNAARNASGSTITFSNFPAVNSFDGVISYTDGYVIYTNAPVSALQDPNGILNVLFNTGASYGSNLDLWGLTAPSSGGGGGGGGGTGVPEPGTLALFGLAFAALGLRNRRQASQPAA